MRSRPNTSSEMDEYKDRRYSGLHRQGSLAEGQVHGLPAEANQIFAKARAGYVRAMQQVIGIGGRPHRR